MTSARWWGWVWLGLLGPGLGLVACQRKAPGQSKAPDARQAPSALAATNTLPAARPLPAHGWSPDKEALHALNRLAYGPRPGDLEAVKKAGVSAWIQGQLTPDTLGDEAVLARLRELPTLPLSTQQLLTAYPRPTKADKAEKGDKGDKAEKGDKGDGGKRSDRGDRTDRPGKGNRGDRNGKPDAATPAMGEAPEAGGGPEDILRQLVAQKLLRAVGSERQLHEKLVDFWFNHFNVFARKGQALWMITPYERDAIRPFVLGTFRQLLGATAHHPAMLFYLDNWQSKKGAINENYARELLELHTLGVEGGYSQQDVTEAARVLTGFSIDTPGQLGTFVYRANQHDATPATVLGKRFEGKGEDQGERLLDLLAAHPATAKFLCTSLASAFVTDTPAPSLVASLVKTYEQTGGDLRAVYQTLFYSPEFWSDAAYQAQTKKPLELVVSAVRAVGAEVEAPAALANRIAGMGEPLYLCQPPTGYRTRADAWIGTGALIARINFGIALAGGRLKGVAFDRDRLVAGAPPGDEGALADRLAGEVLHGPLSAPTRTVIVDAVSKNSRHVDYQEPPPTALPQTLGLLLGSPEFQKR